MNQQETLDRVLLEIRTNNVPHSADIIPSIEFVPLSYLGYYLNLMYAIGYHEGKKSGHGHKKQVVQSSPANRPLHIWPSEIEAARSVGSNQTKIWKAIKEKKLYKGYRWAFYHPKEI